MEERFIQLEDSDVLRLGIKTKDGIDTGEVLEFDLADIELPLRYQELIEKDKKNKENLKIISHGSLNINCMVKYAFYKIYFFNLN